jgi:glycosyltransferase involved in cell wall biosynthesis
MKTGGQVFFVPSPVREVALQAPDPETPETAILEAFAAGVPVIASRIGGLPELVEHDVNGLLVDVDDTKGWLDALERLMDDGESKRLGEGAYRTWQQRFTPEIGLENLLAAYDEAIGTYGG